MLCTLYIGICEVEPTPKGWFIKYIDRDPETIKRQAVDYQPPDIIVVKSIPNLNRLWSVKSKWIWMTRRGYRSL